MVSSRSDTKRRRRDSSPLDANPKRTKVHAQRKFAQGVSSLSNLLHLTPVKEKSEKSSGSSGNLANGLKASESLGNHSDVVTTGKRALPARGAKKPSIEDMITFLCYRGTTALPSHLVHLNKAPSPEPTLLSQQGSSDNSRNRLGDKSKESEKKTKKPLKSAASSALKAVNAAQALKRKYQEQRIKKTTVSTLTSKVKSTPILRTTRSNAGAVVNISSKTLQKKVGTKKVETRKKDSTHKENLTSKKSSKTSSGKPSISSPSLIVTPSSGNRGGLRSGKVVTENVVRSSRRNLGTSVTLKTKQKSGVSSPEGGSPLSKKLATSLSDFSSEDDQPLVKKPKPLVQVQKLIKKSIANIGRKMKMEPRRSRRGLSSSPSSPPSAHRFVALLPGQANASTSNNNASDSQEDNSKQRTGSKKLAASSSCKDVNGVLRKSQSNDNDKKDVHSTPSTTPVRMKKGYVMELVCDTTGETDSEVLETRSRRGSRDMRDTSLEDKANINHGGQDHVKNLPAEIKKKDQSKVAEQSKNLPTESKRKETKATEQSKKVGNGATPKPANTKATSSLSKSQLDLPLAAVLKSPPDLRIPSSIKRPLTAVGITNPMAIAAAAAVVCKSSTSTVDDKGKPKESPQSKDSKDKKDIRKRESTSGNSKSLKSNSSKEDDKTDSDQNKAQEETNIKVVDKISSKQDRLKYGGSPKKKSDDTSDENTKVVSSMSTKDTKLMKVRTDLNSSCKKTVKDEDTKLPRTSRRSGFKVPSDEDEAPLTGSIAIKKGSDEDEVKLSPRTRRSNVRLSKKAVCSDEEEPTEEVSKISEGKDAKVSIQSRKKICNTESDQDQKKKHYTRQGKVHSSDDEYHVKRTKRDKKKVSRSYDDASSDNGRSGDDNLSDDVSPSTSKPSTRSAVKSHVLERKSSRSTRSGKILDNSEENYSTARSKFRPKSEVSSSEEDSDSESSISPAVPTTRSRTVRKSHSKREASSDSSDEGTDGKISGRSRRSTALKKVLSRGSRSASSESTSDSSFEDNTLGGDRSHRKPTSNKKLLSKKSIRKASSVQARPKSSENDHGGKRQNDDEEGNDVKLRRRQSRSPRRSSRRSTLVKNNESKNVSSASDASSSDSSPSQNRRVLRQRRGFFSFAEVDPPSDSEEDVIAATKASLEMINQQQSTDSTTAVDSLTKDIPEKDLVLKSIETDSSGSKQTKNFSQEPITCTKKAKLEPSNVKKSLSKKRIKPVSEVQSNLNEELEKTLLSINLSPKMDKSSDKSLQDDTALESSGTAISDSVAYTSEPFLTSMSLTSSMPSAPPSKLHQTGSKTISVDTPLPITSSLVVPCSSSLLTCATTASGSRGAHTTMSQMPSASKSKSSSTLASDATLLSSTYGSSLSIKPALPAPMPSMAAPSGMSFNPNSTHSNIGTKVAKAVLTSTSMSAFSNACSSTFSTPPVLMKGQSVSCNLLPIPSGGLSTIATSSTLGIPSTVLSASGQLLTSMQTQVPSALATAVPASISSSVTTALPTPLTLPISAPIPLSTQLGIPLQTSGNMPLSVPMSTTMTLPLQVGPLSSGTSAAAPFLLPVQSALTSMLAPGQTIIKKESSNLAGITNSVGSAPLMVGMNPLVVNSNRGTIFLSTGSTMTMTSSQQQMVSGPIMPSLLSLRLPDKPQQTIMASSPLYVPFAFGNSGIIQTQAQVQPQIQTMAGVSTITAMATNIQNSMGTNMPNTMSTNLQNAMTASVQNVSPNIQNALVTNIQSVSSASTQHSMVGNIQNSASISSACSPMLTHAQGTGTGMKRQLVLANKNGTMSKLILSVGEDGSHVLAAASPNSVPSSEGQTLMSVMQPVQSSKSGPQVNTTSSLQTLPSFSSQSVSISKGSQPLVSVTAGSQPVKQTTISAPKITATFSSQATSGSIVPVTASFISTPVPTSKPLHSTLLSKASNASVSPSKSGLVVTSIVPSSTSSASVESRAVKSGNLPKFAASSSITSNTFPSSSSAMSLASNTSIISSETNKASSTVSTVSCSRTLATPIKADMKQSTTPLIRSSASLVVSSATKPQENRPTSSISTSSSKSSPVVDSLSSKPLVSGKTTIPPDPKVALTGSPVRSVAHGDLITTSSSNTSIVTSPALTSRIPSAPAALAALKSSGTLASTRAIAKTGSSRKPYSTAASYASAKTSDSSELVTPSTSPAPASSGQLPSPIMRVTSSQMPPIITSPLKETVSKVSVTPSPSISKSSISAVSTNTDVKRKGTEVELASTHRTLTMLSTAFQGLEKKRDISARKVIETPGSSEKQTGKLNVEKSGLDSLAEVATSLAERSSDGTLCDKRIPEHSLWANPAQILGKETLRVPGLPITANIGTNLPTKNDLAKMKSGAVLADALEKRSLSDIEKLCKVRGNSPGSKCEKSSVSGLLTGSTAETPCQKVQKWLEDGSNLEMEHKHNCRLLSNGSNCTCDVMEEDISNLNSLAEVCVSMERINSPSKEQKNAKQTNKSSTEKKKRNERGDSLKSGAQISPVKSSLPLDSDQMKVTWRNAFGVKSPAKSSKVVNSTQSKRVTLSDELKKIQTTGNMLLEKSCTITADSVPPTALFGQNYGKDLRKQDEGAESSSTDETSQEKKLAQRKSLLGRIPDPSTNLKLDSAAFSADNESSVYAFEAETDTPPVSQPFRRRSKTLSRSDEEDSTSVGSISHPLTVQVSKDPVYVPIQVEIDENIPRSGLLEVPSEKTCNPSNDSQNDDSDVYYIPLGGQEGHEGDVRAVAVRLGKKGPNNRVVMSAKIVKKPPTFKHPNDTAEDGLPNKRVKMEMSSQAGQHSGQQADAKTSAKKSLESKTSCQNVGSKAKSPQEKTKRETHFSITDSSGEDTSPLPLLPSSSSSSSKDTKEFKSSMSPASSRNKSPMSDIASPSASQCNSKGKGRLNRQSSIDSDASEKAKSSRRGSKGKSSSSRASPSPSLPSTSSTSSGPSRPSQKSNRSYNGPVPGNISEAPVFHPTEKEFQDPYAYIEKIRPIAEKYGLCRIVAPHSFKPDCNVEDDIRFTADNQYVHKMMDRWGPNAKEMRAIVKYIDQHNIHLKHPPLVGGMELDLPRLYTTVQNFGGLMEVMDKKRWVKVAETMRIPKSAQDRASKLDEVYCKCLLPYETLKTGERDNLFEMVEVEWEMRKERRDKRLAASASSPDEAAADSQADDEDDDEEEDSDADEEDECIVKGRSMPLTTFYRTARNTTHMWFKGSSPSASEVEHEFWRHVRDRNFHICVNAGSVDCSDPPYGFPIRNSPFAKHPWNLKVFSNSNGSVLRSLGSIIGVTVPTLHFGMVFTTCCWYRDPHGLPWIEYLHTGAKKIWYGIPEHGSEKFRSAMQDVAPHYVRKKALWLASDTAMIPPNMLTERKVPLCRTVQEPGQFIVVFPRAHTSSVATGYIVSESVSFAPPSWLLSAMESFREMQKCNEPPLFSLDKLIFAIAEDPRSSLNVLNTILSSVMEILEREITSQQELKKKGVTSTERMERSRKKSAGKKSKIQKELEDVETLECEVCSTILFLSMVVNKEDQSRYCLAHASSFVDQEKLSPSQCKLLYTYTQNELHEFCQNLLDRIEAKSGKKGNNSSGNNSDSGSSASTSTRN